MSNLQMNDINKFKKSLIKDLYDLSVNCDITVEELSDDICDDCKLFYNQALDECKQILLDAMAKNGKTKCHEYMVAVNEMEKLKL